MKRKIETCRSACFQCVLICTFLLLQIATAARVQATDKQVKIGVLAVRGADQCLKSWSPTADYLTRQIPGYTFVILPLAHNLITSSVQNAEVDFILTNSSYYVELEQGYEVNRIATLKEMRLGRVYSKYGSVIFSRSDRTDIRKLSDLKGKSYMGVSEGSFGGWQMAWRELRKMASIPTGILKHCSMGRLMMRLSTRSGTDLLMLGRYEPIPWSNSAPRVKSICRTIMLFPVYMIDS